MDITVKARAKINLALDVIGKRDDGYHDLRMIMQTVYLHDQLVLKRVDKYPLKLVCGTSSLPVDERNLVYRAALYMRDRFKPPGGLFIALRKRIPISAGLAGGSSDCAATLLGINRMYNLGLSLNELMEIGLKFGADVPFCLLGGTALAEGKGEILTPLPSHPSVSVIIGKPPVSISTAAVFKAFDSVKHTKNPNIDRVISGIKKKDIVGIASGFGNVLEDVSVDICPDIVNLKNMYMDRGAIGALMSGSGPSVFAYFSDQRQAWAAMKNVGLLMPHITQFLTGTFNDTKPGSDF
ncbi:MAG: 4-(cytidine 5'-diphospho)-2-C-methyl-D-erythritol kinase [Clostridiales bacterium]|jgi:4-diphosphocytidyl-2-C-methyl-D-erythritol kinase|nr:4-(cytidine 5'-diphospho)-2-C-methyl-D-erythritol kinase [Clostridiales bacterium]